jgi:hypothetical protein
MKDKYEGLGLPGAGGCSVIGGQTLRAANLNQRLLTLLAVQQTLKSISQMVYLKI